MFNFKKKNILVTGGCGFIGSHLVEKLVSSGAKVTVVDNLSTGRIDNIRDVLQKIKFVNCDIANYRSLYKLDGNFDYVFHLAALADIVPSIKDPQKYFKSNVIGTESLINFFKNKKLKKFIYTASSSCYGIPKKYPTPENSKLNPQYPYALTKMLGEQIVKHYSEVFNIPYISLRFFNVYGTRSRTSGTYGAVFGVFLAQKLANKPLTVVGDGKQTRDFTYVSDVVDAMILAAKSKRINEIYNVGSGKTVSINEIVKILKGKKLFIPKRPGEPECTFASIKKIKRHLNWKPKIKIEEGINKMINEIHYWKTAPIWTPSKIKKATKEWFEYL